MATPNKADGNDLQFNSSEPAKDAYNQLNYTYQEVPGALSDEEEIKQVDVKRQTEKAEFHYDESLFLDKVKDFNRDES